MWISVFLCLGMIFKYPKLLSYHAANVNPLGGKKAHQPEETRKHVLDRPCIVLGVGDLLLAKTDPVG